MNTFRLLISTPDGNKFEGDAVKLTLRGAKGDLAILAGHIPFVTSVVPCDCYVWTDGETAREAHVEGGLLSVTKEKTTFLASTFEWTEE